MPVRSRAARFVNNILRCGGLELRRLGKEPASTPAIFQDVEPWVAEIIERVRPFTMTSDVNISALCHAARYISRCNIQGDVVECGVWRGGSIMAAAITLLAERDLRVLYLYDTFDGMPPPGTVDRVALSKTPAADLLEEADRSSNIWAYATIEEVRVNVASTGYPTHSVRFVQGKVEDTIPIEAPREIALLRLDTDWYSSTKHELQHLFPRLSPGGVVIIDDYGYWEGSRKATDEYINENRLQILLQRIDYNARIAVKMGEREGIC